MVTSTKPDGTAITYTYDDKHRMVSQTDGRGVTTTYSYDGPNMTDMWMEMEQHGIHV